MYEYLLQEPWDERDWRLATEWIDHHVLDAVACDGASKTYGKGQSFGKQTCP